MVNVALRYAPQIELVSAMVKIWCLMFPIKFKEVKDKGKEATC